MSRMVQFQEIVVDGVLAGVVIDEQMLLRAGLEDEQGWIAAAMGVFAIDIHTGVRPGPYRQRQAFLSATESAHRRRVRTRVLRRSDRS
jgi:hypothetical protein